MKLRTVIYSLLCLLFLPVANAQSFKPSNPDASAEAKALIELFYRISGKYTLTGQHNYPNTKDRNSRFAAKYAGQTPAIWSTDMGFAKEDDTDSYLARPDIVKEAIRQHKKGSIVTICWHAVPPTADEPVTFQPQEPYSPDSLISVQGQLLDYQFKELLTPGTRLYNRWAAQVDSVARYLKLLDNAKVPVLWRPYHEMNGDWFWWGGRVGEYSTIDLYRQLYERLVNIHNLTNLVWVWNVDRPSTPIRKFSNFYPGNEYLDILSLDVYGADFNQDYYDSLMALSKGKPLLFGEVGNPPFLEILDAQPNWTAWVIWAGFVRYNSKEQFRKFVESPRMLYQEDPAYWQVMEPYRKACRLPLLPLKDTYPAYYSGEWVLNEEKSDFGNAGPVNSAYKLIVEQDNDLLLVKRFNIIEWGDDQIRNDEIYLDGTPVTTKLMFNTPGVSTAILDAANKSLTVNTTAKFRRGEQSFEIKSSEVWTAEDACKSLKIVQNSTGFRGEAVTVTLVYDKK